MGGRVVNAPSFSFGTSAKPPRGSVLSSQSQSELLKAPRSPCQTEVSRVKRRDGAGSRSFLFGVPQYPNLLVQVCGGS